MALPFRTAKETGQSSFADIAAANGLLKEGATLVELGRAGNMPPYGDYYHLEAPMRSVGRTAFPWSAIPRA